MKIVVRTAILGIVAACALLANAAPIPTDVKKQLADRLPAAFVPVPASGANKIFPLISKERQSPDRKYSVALDGTPFALTAISDDGKIAELAVPAGYKSTEFTTRWFKVEDVFGKIDWKLEAYEPKAPCLAYFNAGKRVLDLVAKIPNGQKCAALGTVAIGKNKRRLMQARLHKEAAGEQCEFMLVFTKENPPVKTEAEYNARAKQLFAEHAFREGRPWGKMAPSVLGNNSCYECAAMAADFATYMFDGSLKSGERFEKADEIRSGDVIFKEGHFFAVVFRKGDQLTTIEGNMNKCVSRSNKRYAVKDGKLISGGKDAVFVYGYHNWPPAARE